MPHTPPPQHPAPFVPASEALAPTEAASADETQRRQELLLEQLLTRLEQLEMRLARGALSDGDMVRLNPRLSRDLLPVEPQSAQMTLLALWQNLPTRPLTQQDLFESGFRVFSQNDEDGVLLRLFSVIGQGSRQVVEIGSNCGGSATGLPENLSTNLIVNHGWHGIVLELDAEECNRMRYFFARNPSTRHFHVRIGNQDTYYSPKVIQAEVSASNVDQLLATAGCAAEPDLLIIDTDGEDYAILEGMQQSRPRVIVVEFEKRFRDRHAVVQQRRQDFSSRWVQSGSVSLPAWEQSLGGRGYRLCGIANCGFNAFFVRSDQVNDRLQSTCSKEAFAAHPILSQLGEDFWLTPDETWTPL